MIILPLLCYAIIDCVDNDKRVLLIILYSYLFISQFYMGYMVGVFSLFFTVLYIFLIYKNQSNSNILIKKFLNWGLGVVIAIMISAFIWIPTLFFLLVEKLSHTFHEVKKGDNALSPFLFY